MGAEYMGKYCLIKKIIMNSIQKQNTFIPFLFDDFINREFNLDKSIFETYPAVNIKELDSLFQIELAVPGKNKNDFQIEIEGGLLTISSNLQHVNSVIIILKELLLFQKVLTNQK